MAAILIAITVSVISFLGETILKETMPPMAKMAALAVECNPDMREDVLGNLDLSRNSNAYIIDRQGKFIAHRDMDRVKAGEGIFTDYPGEQKIIRILGQLESGQTEWVKLMTGTST